ncbi:MAG: M55 family metallopeptidase [Armatimonadetes bacterium]|nr:M55 family metallopeptidase [Armatimonadota bacterium]
MRVLIATDMEGAAGIDRAQQCFPGYPEIFRAGCRHLIEDINACIHGLRRGGATEVKVAEGHALGAFRAFDSGDLEGTPEIVRGRPAMEALESWAQAVALVGYHAMAGTPDGFLSHTVTLSTALRLDGEPVGEMVMTAATFGLSGVPVILVTGDHATVREAAHFLPWAARAEVKRAATITDVTLLPREEASRRIEQGAAAAMARRDGCRPLCLPEPLETEVHFWAPELADAAMVLPLARRCGERAVGFTAPTLRDALKFFSVAWQMMMPARDRALRQQVDALPEVQRQRDQWTDTLLRAWLRTPSPFQANPNALRTAL